MSIELTDTNASEIASAAAAGAPQGRLPGHGHGADAGRRHRRGRPLRRDEGRARRSRASTRRGSWSSIRRLGAAAQPNLDAEVRVGEAGSGETVLLRLYGELAKHAESVVLPLLLPDSPVVVWWPGDGAGGPGGRPARRAGPAPDHRRGRDRARPRVGDARPRPTQLRRRATPTWLDPAHARGGRCSPRRSTSTRPRSRAAVVAAERATRAPTCWPPGCSDRLGVPVEQRTTRKRPGHHRGDAGHRRRRHRDHAAGRALASSRSRTRRTGRSR